MPAIKDYFYKNRYHPTWFLGDRVEGKWNKIPFVGTVANDSLVDEDVGPRVSVFLDLPILYQNKWHNIITLKIKDVKARKSIST